MDPLGGMIVKSLSLFPGPQTPWVFRMLSIPGFQNPGWLRHWFPSPSYGCWFAVGYLHGYLEAGSGHGQGSAVASLLQTKKQNMGNVENQKTSTGRKWEVIRKRNAVRFRNVSKMLLMFSSFILRREMMRVPFTDLAVDFSWVMMICPVLGTRNIERSTCFCWGILNKSAWKKTSCISWSMASVVYICSIFGNAMYLGAIDYMN